VAFYWDGLRHTAFITINGNDFTSTFICQDESFFNIFFIFMIPSFDFRPQINVRFHGFFLSVLNLCKSVVKFKFLYYKLKILSLIICLFRSNYIINLGMICLSEVSQDSFPFFLIDSNVYQYHARQSQARF